MPTPVDPNAAEAARLDALVASPAPGGGYVPKYVDPISIGEDVVCPRTEVKWTTNLAQCWGTLPATKAKDVFNTNLKKHLSTFVYAHDGQDNRGASNGPVYADGEFTGLAYKYFYCGADGNWAAVDLHWYFDEFGSPGATCKVGPVGK